MRYRYEEFAPTNKRQYVIAVGVHELRALLDAARVVLAHTPDRTREQSEYAGALKSSIRGLTDAIEYAESIKDDGKRRKPYKGEE